MFFVSVSASTAVCRSGLAQPKSCSRRFQAVPRLLFVTAIAGLTAGCAANTQSQRAHTSEAPSALTRTVAYDPDAVRHDAGPRGAHRFSHAAAAPMPSRVDPIEPFSPNYGSVDPETARQRRSAEPWTLPADYEAASDVVVPGYAPTPLDGDVDSGH